MLVHQLIEAHAAQSPESVALVEAEGICTFGELNRRADGCANVLRASGLEAGSLVGLYGDRSRQTAVALLAILKAGGGYVALDSGSPPEQIRRIIRTVQLSKIVNALPEFSPPALESAEYITLPVEAEYANASAGSTLASLSDAVAAVISTSGSEGVPKAVAIPHRAILARYRRPPPYIAYDEPSCYVSPFFTVGHISSLLVPLMSGRSVLAVPDDVVRDPFALARLTRRHGVTCIPMVPSQLSALLSESTSLKTLQHLRTISLRAEPVPPELIETAKERLPHVALINGYGTTETAGLVSYSWINDASRVVIGCGHRGEMHILDGDAPVPDGTTGELCISGPQVALGYINEPELTAKHFVAAYDRSETMFRTGDLARRLPDGSIEILGRADQQVKVRGFRINLAEVEAALYAIAGVRRAAVLLQRKRINAYVAGDLEESDLRDVLRGRLPDRMVPHAIFKLSELPVLPSGKIDRHALAARAHDPANTGGGGSESKEETTIAEIWREVIGAASFNPDDDFFEIGGSSLDAMIVLLRLEQTFGVRLELEDFYRNPTVQALNRRLMARRVLSSRKRL